MSFLTIIASNTVYNILQYSTVTEVVAHPKVESQKLIQDVAIKKRYFKNLVPESYLVTHIITTCMLQLRMLEYFL